MDGEPPVPQTETLYYSTINEHYAAITKEEPATIDKAATGWKDLGTAFSTAAKDIRTSGNTLATKWEGAAKDAFLLKVGMLTLVLDNWAKAASANATALSKLFPVVRDKRNEMVKLWLEYKEKSDSIRQKENANADIGEFWEDTKEFFGGKDRLSKNLEEYSAASRRDILTPLSTAFDQAFYAMQSGAVYEGPRDAVKRTPEGGSGGGTQTPGRPGAPGAPGAPGVGAPPAAPGRAVPPAAPGTPPTAPGAPLPPAPMAFLRQAPERPDLTSLRAMLLDEYSRPPENPLHAQALENLREHYLAQTTPPADPGTMARPAFVAPVAPSGLLSGRGAMPAAPGSYSQRAAAAPGAPRSATASPGAPGTARPAAPGVPGGLGGRSAPSAPKPAAPGAPGAPGAAARRPASPGLGGRNAPKAPAAPERSGLGGGAPSLGGRTARPGTPGGGRPGAPGRAAPTLPSSLQGRSARPAGPAGGTRGLVPRVEMGAGAKSAPPLAGRTAPRTAARQQNVEAARRALRSSLAGRPASSTGMTTPSAGSRTPQRTTDRLRAEASAARASGTPGKDRRETSEDDAIELSLVGGTELFEATDSGDGVLAARGPQGPVTRPGPALGDLRRSSIADRAR